MERRQNLENQYNSDHQYLKDEIDYSQIQRIEKARLAAHYAVEKEISKRLTIIFASYIISSVLIALGVILLLAAGVHYIWG